ncbi:MAG: hypothetical protein WC967_13210 [Balneolaceae bacterium]
MEISQLETLIQSALFALSVISHVLIFVLLFIVVLMIYGVSIYNWVDYRLKLFKYHKELKNYNQYCRGFLLVYQKYAIEGKSLSEVENLFKLVDSERYHDRGVMDALSGMNFLSEKNKQDIKRFISITKPEEPKKKR